MPIKNNHDIVINETGLRLPGNLVVPPDARGIVLFAHGSGSSRQSPRNIHVARLFNRAGLATLLFDLLTEEESFDRENVFDIPLLAKRLIAATNWVSGQAALQSLGTGYFGASTGAAAALMAAANLGRRIAAVVSRGGRPDLARSSLELVTSPTLLIVGGKDDVVLELNQKVLPFLAKGELMIIPGATHLFEEHGTLEQVATEATQWFTRFLGQGKKAHRVA